MTDVFGRTVLAGGKPRHFLIVLFSALYLLTFLIFPLAAQTRQDVKIVAEIKVAANNVKYNWGSGKFLSKKKTKAAAKVKKRRRVKKRRITKKSRKKSRKKILAQSRAAKRNRTLISRSRKRAQSLAKRNRLLAKELRRARKKDVCGYPWVYAYKYKRCICERRGFAQLGSRCVRLARHCAGGSVWSSTSRKCLCKAGFEYQNKQCINVAAIEDDDDEDDEEPPQLTGGSCAAPATLASLSDTVGECPDGYKVRNGKCELTESKVVPAPVKAAKIIMEVLDAPKIVSAVPTKATLSDPIYDLVQIRSCLYKAGFEGDRAGRAKYTTFMETYDAFRKFRERHRLTHKAMDIYDLESQQILFGLCQNSVGTKNLEKNASNHRVQDYKRQAAVSQTENFVAPVRTTKLAGRKRTENRPIHQETVFVGSNDGYDPVEVTGATRPFSMTDQKASTCLPSDLYDFLTTTYGQNSGLKKCGTPCLPAPTSMTEVDKYSYGEKFGIKWCGKSCLNVSSYMPLDEVLKVEKNARVQVCTNPTTTLLFSKEKPRLIGRSYPKARGLYRDFPESASNVNTIAVIIGNKKYSSFGENSNALNDAGAMFSLLSEHLGYSVDNIFDLRNATLAKMEDVLGSVQNAHGKLWQRMQRHPNSRVMIYYSGHALNNVGNGKNYLLPIDAVKGREVHTGYSISLMLNNLRKLRASSIMLVLETEFGRKTGNAVSPPNAAELPVQLQSSVPVPGLTIFLASHGNQKALEDPDYGIGLFTRHFIAGLAGGADRRPIGNGDGKIDVVELYVHTASKVRLTARKSFGLLQNPTLGQTGNMVISRLKTSSNGR